MMNNDFLGKIVFIIFGVAWSLTTWLNYGVKRKLKTWVLVLNILVIIAYFITGIIYLMRS